MLRSKFNSKHKLVIRCSDLAAEELVPLLKELKFMGNAGCSRSIKIEDYDGEHRFGFDGDGPSSIESIELDGKIIKSVEDNMNLFILNKGKIKASCGDELEHKLKEEGMYIKDKKQTIKSKEKDMDFTKGKDGVRGVPDGSGPEGKGATGRLKGKCPQRENFESDEEFDNAMKTWKEKSVEKSITVLMPTEILKAAKLSKVGAAHVVKGPTKVSTRLEKHEKAIRAAQDFAKEHIYGAPKPDRPSEPKRVPGRKPVKDPYDAGNKKPSGMNTEASNLFDKEISKVNVEMGAPKPSMGQKTITSIVMPIKKKAPKPRR